MIVWRKLGILGLVIPIGLGLVLQLIFGNIPAMMHTGFLLGAIPVWYLGRKWNTQIDLQNKMNPHEESILKHSMFWIHLEYWGIVFAVFGAMELLASFLFHIDGDSIFSILGIVLVAIVGYQIYSGRNQFVNLLNRKEKPKPQARKKMSATPPKSTTPETFKPTTKNDDTERERILKDYKTEDHSKYMPKSGGDNAQSLKTV